MSKKNIIFLIIAIVFFIIAICIFVYANKTVSGDDEEIEIETEVIEIGESFIFYDDNLNEFSIENFKEKPIAMVLWSSDTENSFEIVELVEEVYSDYKNDVNFLVINTDEPDEDIMEVIEKCDYSFEVYYDLDNVVSSYYEYSSLPTLIFIDSDGEISNKIETSITEDSLLANLDLIAENY